jgi:hypothetical protein
MDSDLPLDFLPESLESDITSAQVGLDLIIDIDELLDRGEDDPRSAVNRLLAFRTPPLPELE